MASRSLTASLALLAVASALAVPAARAVIVPQHGIAGVRLGMTQADVRAVLGPPRRVVRGSNEFGRYGEFRYRALRIVFQGERNVTFVSTTRRSERTAGGIGVGSPQRRVRQAIPAVRCRSEDGARLCVLGKQLPGRRVTVFFMRRGHVARVDVGFVID